MQATSRAPKKAIVDREIDSRHDVFFWVLLFIVG